MTPQMFTFKEDLKDALPLILKHLVSIQKRTLALTVIAMVVQLELGTLVQVNAYADNDKEVLLAAKSGFEALGQTLDKAVLVTLVRL